jgi:uncharacterized membrane protein AbrB (regulator of aidB expression)
MKELIMITKLIVVCILFTLSIYYANINEYAHATFDILLAYMIGQSIEDNQPNQQ